MFQQIGVPVIIAVTRNFSSWGYVIIDIASVSERVPGAAELEALGAFPSFSISSTCLCKVWPSFKVSLGLRPVWNQVL